MKPKGPANMQSGSSSLVVIRTHYYDAEVAAFCDGFQRAGLDLVIAADESKNPVDVGPDFDKLSLTGPILCNLGLRPEPDFGWRCGDYALYVARGRYPSYRHYFLLEPDVFFNVPDLAALFRTIEEDRSSDLLACHLKRAAATWYWYKPIFAYVPEVWRCLFSFIRVSGRGIDELLQKRIDLSKLAMSDSTLAARWPNDESFVASVLSSGDRFEHRDFKEIVPRLYTPLTFSFYEPFSRQAIERAGFDGQMYHPVLAGERFLHKTERLIAAARETNSIRAYLIFSPKFFSTLAIECGTDTARELHSKVVGDLKGLGWSVAKLNALIAIRRISTMVRWYLRLL